MVEFLLVARRKRKGFAAPARDLSQIPVFADIKILSSSRHLVRTHIWETSTFTSSVYARAECRYGQACTGPDVT